MAFLKIACRKSVRDFVSSGMINQETTFSS